MVLISFPDLFLRSTEFVYIFYKKFWVNYVDKIEKNFVSNSSQELCFFKFSTKFRKEVK